MTTPHVRQIRVPKPSNVPGFTWTLPPARLWTSDNSIPVCVTPAPPTPAPQESPPATPAWLTAPAVLQFTPGLWASRVRKVATGCVSRLGKFSSTEGSRLHLALLSRDAPGGPRTHLHTLTPQPSLSGPPTLFPRRRACSGPCLSVVPPLHLP